ncbi:tRNA sulfurtransferase [Haladaptatus sp. R4]|uniref:tRNA uracil 4-sulfurtransferase ThiI n=1 Tax=Haladaptatus sp. R4 TaxID=1679489 RepID=UPI0007B4AB0F|nr:tRNA uracil 4-sulfurtransferase ThiI [Haladaptatus sp. R4]KZN25673.1 tRNA sulfurtransferase [Haladaptatus sp. R4]
MHPSGADTVLVRHGDVGVKSGKVQTEMEKRLRDNIAAILEARDIDAEVERQWSRLLVHTTEADVEEATAAAADTFGVQSASPAAVVSPEQEVIEETLADAAREQYDGGTFAVRARRATKDHPFTSTELEREGGTAVWNAVEDPEVDLDDPDITFFVEVRDSDAFVFLEKRDGPGGLPLGTQTKLVSLVSGGIDSPVATWEVMKRGSPIVPIYLDLGDYGGIDHQARAIETVRKLARYAPNQDMRVRKVPAGEAMNLLGEEVGPARMLVFRRFMYRVAEHIANEESAHGIVTGEAIGQKSSQTARNLGVVSTSTSMPVHRPLLTMDKSDIVARARRIDTFTESTIPAGCNRLAPDYPETNATHEIVDNAEPDGLYELAKEATENVEIVEL